MYNVGRNAFICEETEMILKILTVILNAVYVIVLNLDIYTDRAMMPNGQTREWRRSPIARLNISDQSTLLYVQLFLIAVSVISAVLLMFGIKNDILKKVWIISSVLSAVMFVIIMIVTSNTHAEYA